MRTRSDEDTGNVDLMFLVYPFPHVVDGFSVLGQRDIAFRLLVAFVTSKKEVATPDVDCNHLKKTVHPNNQRIA